MLSLGNAAVGSGASLSLDARVAVGAGVFAVSQADTSAAPVAEAAATGTEQKLPAYNAFEFSYRSDFGKIILLEQNVDTGQEVTQIPTEYHLQQYAQTQRNQRLQQLQQLYQGSTPGGSGKTTTTTVARSDSGLSKTTTVAASGAPAPAQTAAPAPAPAVAAAASAPAASAPAARVNITV